MNYHEVKTMSLNFVINVTAAQRAGARITQKKKLHPKFLQNRFLHTSIYVIQGKFFYSAIESTTQNFF